MSVKYNIIFHHLRAKYNLTLMEYCILDSIDVLSHNREYDGWCVISKDNIAKFIGCSRRKVQITISKLEQLGLLIRSEDGNNVQTTDLFIKHKNAQKELGGDINKKPKETITKESKSIYIHIYQKFPRVMKMQEPLTDGDMEKLLLDYEQKDVETVLSNMENWKPLLQKNVSAYKTALNWLKRGFKTKDNKRFRLSS